MSSKSGAEQPFRKRGICWGRLYWPVVIGIGTLHAGSLLGPLYFSWSAVLAAAALVWLTGGLGITLCYHRLLTHRSFKTPKWFEYFLTILGCMAWQGGPIQWVGTHRIHHKHSDQELDPHTPKHGFTWAHIFWCMHKESEGQVAADAAKDLQRDPVMRLIDRYFWLPQLFLAGALYGIGHGLAAAGFHTSGLSWLIWGVCVRTVVVYHGTWFVNSASHTWGYRNFNTRDHSTNLWWVALLSFGEGWHNNHHAFQRSAAHGLRWFEFDATYLTIRLLGWMGLAWDIVLPQKNKLRFGAHQPEGEGGDSSSDSRDAAPGRSPAPTP
ncbi:MAG TPA: fatty acid desaturase [Phycisphaeraceae bacterium]